MRLLIAAPFLLVLVLFALTNRAVVSLGLWPTGLQLEAPLSLVVLGAAGVAFLAGAVLVWVNELAQRRRARRAEAQVRRLEEEVAILRGRLAAPGVGWGAGPGAAPGVALPAALVTGPGAGPGTGPGTAGRVSAVPGAGAGGYGTAGAVAPVGVTSARVLPAGSASGVAAPGAPTMPPGAR
jgi:uncharacterized integral membrane protein